MMGVVEVSRSIGDGRFKRCGVTSVPDVFRCQISEEDRWVETTLPQMFFPNSAVILGSGSSS